jgi:hypothetical protein
MSDAASILVKAVAGGILVVAFALLGESLHPKRLAGLFSAAPSIAIAGLVVTVVAKGDVAASREALGMIVGAAGFVVFAACVRPLVGWLGSAGASAIAAIAWIGVAVGGYEVLFR